MPIGKCVDPANYWGFFYPGINDEYLDNMACEIYINKLAFNIKGFI